MVFHENCQHYPYQTKGKKLRILGNVFARARVWFSYRACWWHLTHSLPNVTRMCLAHQTPVCTADTLRTERRDGLRCVRDLVPINHKRDSRQPSWGAAELPFRSELPTVCRNMHWCDQICSRQTAVMSQAAVLRSNCSHSGAGDDSSRLDATLSSGE